MTDELGFCKATSYTVKVDMNKKFLVTDGMPAACGEGERVFFPVPVLLDYSEYGKEGFEEIAELYIDGEKISGEYTVPRGVKKLQAEARSKDGSISETFEIAVIPETRTDISDALVYDRENVSAEFFETGLTFTSAGDFSVRTPYAVPFYDLSVKLTFLEIFFRVGYDRIGKKGGREGHADVFFGESGKGKPEPERKDVRPVSRKRNVQFFKRV